MQGEPHLAFHPTSRPARGLAVFMLAASMLAAAPAHAEAGDVTASMEASASRDFRAWSLLGDVELIDDATFLTLGYTVARPEKGTASSHQLALGLDQALGRHWLVSLSAGTGLPKSTRVVVIPVRPMLGLQGVDARTGYASQTLLLSAAYDSAGFSDVEYGLDAGVSLNRYTTSRKLLVITPTSEGTIYAREEMLWITRPSVGARVLLGLRWELGLRASLSLYSGDLLSAGMFTDAEVEELSRRFENAVEARRALVGLRERTRRDLGSVLARRMSDVNATSGIPIAPSRFDLKPSLTWRPHPAVRGQLSYAFTRYVSGEGLSHVLATRWTVRLGEPVRVWASVAVQQDHLGALEDGADAGEPSRVRSGLVTVGGEYTF